MDEIFAYKINKNYVFIKFVVEIIINRKQNLGNIQTRGNES